MIDSVGKINKAKGGQHSDGDSIRYSLYSHRSPKIIAVAGGKGGVGKTVFATMLGMCLAGFERRTILVDLDFSGANLHGFLNLPEKNKSLNAYLAGRASTLSEMVQRTSFEKLDAITFQSDTPQTFSIKPRQKQMLFRELRKLKADYIVCDLGHASSAFGLDAFLRADFSVLLTAADMFSVLNTYSFIRSVLLRGVRQFLHNSPAASRALDECGLLVDGKMVKPLHMFLKQIPAHQKTRLDAIQQFLRRFSPKVVLNFMPQSEPNNDFILLGPLVKNMLNIQLDYWGALRNDRIIQAAMKSQRPDMLLSPDSPASEDLVKLVVRNLIAGEFKGVLGNEPKWIDSDQSILGFNSEEESLKCSSNCLLWNTCDSHGEGGPCSRVAFHQIKKAG